MKRVLPDARFFDMDIRIRSSTRSSRSRTLDISPGLRSGARCSAASTRTTIRRSGCMMIVNYNTDISQFWEWSGTRTAADRRDQRGLQARRQLPDLRDDPLMRRIPILVLALLIAALFGAAAAQRRFAPAPGP